MKSKKSELTTESSNLLEVNITKDIKERLLACLMESNKPDKIAGAIMYEFKIHELEQVVSQLVALYDIAPELLNKFWQSSSDTCPLEASEAERQENEFSSWIYKATR